MPVDEEGTPGGDAAKDEKEPLQADKEQKAPGGKKEMSKEEKLVDECLFVGLQIAAALTYMHQHSIIFRDLKPGAYECRWWECPFCIQKSSLNLIADSFVHR